MSSYQNIIYHIIFRTKNSQNTLNQDHISDLYAYIYGIIRHKQCKLFRINGTMNHIHILSDLHPSIALADYIRLIKTSSSSWMRQSGKFPEFRGWALGYAALTYGKRDREMLINYIKRQQMHHQKISFEKELTVLLKEEGIVIDFRYFP